MGIFKDKQVDKTKENKGLMEKQLLQKLEMSKQQWMKAIWCFPYQNNNEWQQINPDGVLCRSY